MKTLTTTRGKCLCGTVQFSLEGHRFGLYQCHCSECRKISGSHSNASVLVPLQQFNWHSGEARITAFTHRTGYRSDFCSTCGSPVPNRLKDLAWYWVPAGLLNPEADLQVKAHICLASRAGWDLIARQGRCYDSVPDLDELLSVLAR